MVLVRSFDHRINDQEPTYLTYLRGFSKEQIKSDIFELVEAYSIPHKVLR